MIIEVLPVIDLEPYLAVAGEIGDDTSRLSPKLIELCREVTRVLKETGALVVKDPRCTAEDNDRFIDFMEKYYERPFEFKTKQERPDLLYQGGITPEKIEVPRLVVDEEWKEKVKAMPKESQPLIPIGPDPKWRYMWNIGSRPAKTRFKQFNADAVRPEGFPEWNDVMDSWGSKLLSAVETVAEMAAIGFGLPKNAFTSLMKQAPHILGPTGSDLRNYGKEGTILAGYHYDNDFLTIHGRCRFPGLNIWLKNGKKVEVVVPHGCLLVQTGKEIEWLTAGDCLAGMHEVLVTKKTLDAIKLASEQNHSLWRVSSTLFAHIASDEMLKPLGHFAEKPRACKYTPIFAGDFVHQELSAINLNGTK